GLQYLDCYQNQLASLPGLPASLQELRCYQNQLGSLPDPLPASLLRLNCSGNQLTGLPVLPAGLLLLYCSNNAITGLPVLPANLQSLDCHNNYLTSLPDLPASLTELQCYSNLLNVFNGAVKTKLDNCTAATKGATPQYRYNYSGAGKSLSSSSSYQIAPSDLIREQSDNGSSWVSTGWGILSDFSFTSSADAVCTVDANGLITAHTAGNCNIYARFKNIDAEYTKEAIPVNVGSSGGGGGGGGGGTTTTTAATTETTTNTSGTGMVDPAAGGSIGLGNEVTLDIPADALQGTASANVTITAAAFNPPVPSGFRVLGKTYEFTVGSADSYSFNKNITLTFTFDPADVEAGQTPAVYYYDQSSQSWVQLGGKISGNTISVEVDHFTKFTVMTATAEIKTGVYLNDITGCWAEANIKKMVALGAVAGYPDGTFKPDKNISRAEFTAILVNAFKLPLQTGRVYHDTLNSWALDYISTAVAAGIVSGYNEDAFGPDDLITREQMAVMIAKVAKLQQISGVLVFTDNNDISGWAQESVAAVVKNRIFGGYSDGTFQPGKNATRAEAMTVIANALPQ
ncbi:MAG: S-layer homology domain-containing protein, partial [Syntrophomonas sp.]